MRKSLLILVCLLFSTGLIFGQLYNEQLEVVKGSGITNSTNRSESDSHLAIGSSSTLDWELLSSGVTTTLTCVDVASPTVVWVAGEDGVVLKSTDGGTTWTQVTDVPGNKSVYSISAFDESMVLIGAGDGTIYRTINGGSSWIPVSNQSGSFINVVDYWSMLEVYAQGDPTDGIWRLLKSTDAGWSWSLASTLNAPPGEGGFNGSYERIGNNIWFGTNNSKVYYSENGIYGPWTSYTTPGYVNSYGLAFGTTKNGVVALNDGSGSADVYRTTDGGATWMDANFPSTDLANTADFVDGTSWVWVGTATGEIYHSSDNGAVWIQDNLPIGVSGITSLKMIPDANNGFAVGDSGVILKSNFVPVASKPVILLTPNGGEVWEVGSTQTISWNATGQGGNTVTNIAIDYSTDNGSTWISVESGIPVAGGIYSWFVPYTPSAQCLVRLSDPSNSEAFDVSDAQFTINYSTLELISPNGGEEWLVQSTQTITWETVLVEDMTVADVKLEYSDDNGGFWILIETSVPVEDGSYDWELPWMASNQTLVRISDVSDPENFDVSDASFTLLPGTIDLTSPNGGEVWITGDVVDIEGTTEIAGGFEVSLSTDTGANWEFIGLAFGPDIGYSWTVDNYNSQNCLVRIVDPINLMAGDTSDAVFTISPASGVDDLLSEIPTEFALHQNFPNPFNPSTTIYYSVPERSNVRIVVYDLLGKAVAELVNETKSAGNYKAEFNGAQLNSGIYFYRMEAGSFTESRKLMLLK